MVKLTIVQKNQLITQGKYLENKFLSHCVSKELLENQNIVILHLAATGKEVTDRICEIAIISRHSSTMLNTLINPGIPMSSAAKILTGINDEMLADAPGFSDIYPQLRSLIEGKIVLSYSSEFNFLKIDFECKINHLEKINFKSNISIDYLYAKWQNDFFFGKDSYQKRRLFKLNTKRRAKTGALNVYKFLQDMSQSLACEVRLIPKDFLARQLCCSWKNWLGFSYSTLQGTVLDLYICRPRFYWTGDLENTNNGDLENTNNNWWDEIPF